MPGISREPPRIPNHGQDSLMDSSNPQQHPKPAALTSGRCRTVHRRSHQLSHRSNGKPPADQSFMTHFSFYGALYGGSKNGWKENGEKTVNYSPPQSISQMKP